MLPRAQTVNSAEHLWAESGRAGFSNKMVGTPTPARQAVLPGVALALKPRQNGFRRCVCGPDPLLDVVL
jgi:hypothetical protein